MDGREGLAPGTVLKLGTRTGYAIYTVKREIGRGGSCIVYDASYTDNLGNHKLVRVKECCPYNLRLIRSAEGTLSADPRDAFAFTAAKERMKAAYRKNHALFIQTGMTNTVLSTSEIHEANGTVYIVSAWLKGSTFAENQGKTLHDCIALMLSAARVLGRIHEAGYLYLDLKPENILTVEGCPGMVQLFDFDSLVSLEELAEAVQRKDPGILRTSYTRGYAPLEQQTGKLRQIGSPSDLYSLGAVLFHALWHRLPTAFDGEATAEYDFSKIAYTGQTFQDGLFRALTRFFHKTLASYFLDRYQSAGEAIGALEEILDLSDGTKPWLRSSPVPAVPVFYGRERELKALTRLLSENEGKVCSLYGMGGIGKSTLVRRWLAENPEAWDARLWLYDRENLMEAIADDTLVQINTVTREQGEGSREYLKRKLRALGSLAKEQRILFVIDNFRREQVDQLWPLAETGVTLLLISRERLPEGLFPGMEIGEMEEAELASLFAHYARRELGDPEDYGRFRTILSCLRGHTLMTELIARQIAGSYLDLEAAEAMMLEFGLRQLPAEKIDYIRDQTVYRGTILKILDRLVEIDRFGEEDRQCIKLLALFDLPGIRAGLFRELAGLSSLDFVNSLEAAGWIRAEGGRLALHPVMQEYVRAWPWDPADRQAADRMMVRLYGRLRPAGNRHDGDKQFPADYGSLSGLLWTAEQLLRHTGRVSEGSRRLWFRLLMDAPVDQDARVLKRMLELLENPAYLEGDSVLRLYETAAYLQGRLGDAEAAVRILADMKRTLRRHPSAYYLSAYHRAMAVILHNAEGEGNLKKCLRHEDRAIAAARLSTHPEAKRQLAASLLDKATTLLSADLDRELAGELIREAEPLVSEAAGETDYEAYQLACVAAMYSAMEGEGERAEMYLKAADRIAFTAADSDLSLAEHLLDQAAPIRLAMGRMDEAEEAVRQAVRLCEKHPEEDRYLETREGAVQFLKEIQKSRAAEARE